MRTRNKYGVRIDAAGKAARTVDGITFHSQREAKRYSELRLLEKSGEVRNLNLQVKCPIIINGVHICTYVADFVYWATSEGGYDMKQIHEDCKGFRTREYALKKKLMKAIYGIEIQEI